MSSILKSVCELAQEFISQGWDKSSAMKQGWLIAKTKVALHKGVTRFYYLKKDGTLREAHGHLVMSLLPESALKGTGRAPHKGNLTYFDVDKNDWRECKMCFLRKLC